MRLLLIRHGQTPSNVAGLLDTRIPGPGLTELGQEQAEAIPATLAHEPIDAIFASTQIRSQITATPLARARGLEIQVRDGVREIASGDYEMLSDAASVHAYMTAIIAWADGDLDLRLAGGENGHEVMARYDAVIAEAYNAGYAATAIVSHGAIIRAWAGYSADNLGGEYVAEHFVGNTGVVVLDGSPEGGWRALTWMSEAIGGPAVDDSVHAGPAAATE